ncbi:MAG: outer membrane protein assembly factor BamE [Planctomycetota bacterium]
MPKTSTPRRIILGLATACIAGGAAFALGGCLISGSSNRSISGAVVEREQLSTVRLGQSTPDDVTRSLGVPSNVGVDADGREVWTYRWNEHRSSNGSMLLLFSGSSSSNTQRSVHVTFEEGVVSRVRQESGRDESF